MMRPNLYDYLKVLAIITMIIDHLGYYLFPEFLWMRLVGRIAFPIFLFLVWFSWSYKWRRDLFLIGVLLQIFLLFSALEFHYWYLCGNIILGIVLARLVLSFLEHHQNNWIVITLLLFFIILHPLFNEIFDYGSFCLLFAFWGWMAKKKTWKFFFWIFFLIALFCSSIVVFHFSFFQTQILFILYLFLFSLFYLLSKKGNFSLYSSSRVRNNIILFLSKHSLWLYWIHVVILVLLGWQKFGYVSFF